MDAIPTPNRRPKAAKGKSARPRRKSGSSGGAAGSYRVARLVLMVLGASVVFVAAFVIDTEAAIRLFWASLTGHAGLPARVAAFGILLAVSGVVAFGLYQSGQTPPPKARRKTAKRPVRTEDRTEVTEAAGGGPGTAAPVGKRRRKRGPVVAAD